MRQSILTWCTAFGALCAVVSAQDGQLRKSQKESNAVVREHVRGSIHHFGGKTEWDRITGRAKVIDAHTLMMEDDTVLPLNIVSPDRNQMAKMNGTFYSCGEEAAQFLQRRIGKHPVTCYYVREAHVWTAYVGQTNLEYAMVINGWALADHSTMGPAEIYAREHKLGLWRGEFVDPVLWRSGTRLLGEK